MKIRFREIFLFSVVFILSLLYTTKFEFSKISIIQILYLLYFYSSILAILFLLMKPCCKVKIRRKTGFTTNRIKIILFVVFIFFVIIIDLIKTYIFGDKVISLPVTFVYVAIPWIVWSLLFNKKTKKDDKEVERNLKSSK